jgi:hypothetical protein
VSHAVTRYIEEVLPQHRTAVAKVKSRYLQRRQQHIGHIQLVNLSAEHIVAQRALLAQTLAPGTVHSYCKNLSVVLRLAVRQWRWIDVAPMGYVTRLQEPRGRIRYLTPDERDRLLEACKNSLSPHLYILVVLALGTAALQDYSIRILWLWDSHEG